MLKLSRRLTHSIFFRAFHALAIDDGGSRTGFPLRLFATPLIKRVVDPFQCAVIGPQMQYAPHWTCCHDRPIRPTFASRGKSVCDILADRPAAIDGNPSGPVRVERHLGFVASER